MRFHVVMEKTTRELMGPKRMIAIIVSGLVAAALFSVVFLREPFRAGDMSLEMQTHFLFGYFVIFSLMIANLYLGYFVVAPSGQELVAKEEERGTLLLMVSKPISRFEFLLGKYLALVLTTLLLGLIVLLGSVLVFQAMLGLDPDTVRSALGVVPSILLLTTIVVLLFSSISMALSALIKSDVIRGMSLMLVVMLIFGLGPGLRMMSTKAYEGYGLYLLDGGYHLGNTYLLLLGQDKTARMTPPTQAMLGMATGAYEADLMTAFIMFTGASEMRSAIFDPEIGGMPPSLERTAYLNPLISMVLCILLAGAAFGVAYVTLDRKEVQ